MPSKKKRPAIFGGFKACVFCNTEEDDEFVYGKMFHMKNFSVHHNCLFFSSGLVQQKKVSSTGILGFKAEDIRKEVIRGRKLRCCYCKNIGATVGCCIGSCRKTFHLPCGKMNHSLHQFFGSFNSYCESHKPLQKHIKIPKGAIRCHICFTNISKATVENSLYSTCCKNNCYHVTCLQQYAISAGRHFFKCPMCKNSSDFIKEMEYYGISVPEKDASWELEENAFHDLLIRPECGAPTCKCDQGRKYNDGECKWELLYCKLCGSNARHRFCENLGSTVESWTCTECKIVDDQFEINKFQTQVNLEVITQDKCSTGVSAGSLASDCKPTCSSFDSSSCADPRLTSTFILKRALQCVVQITPLEFVTVNGISKPVWPKDDQYAKSSQCTPIELISKDNGMNKSVLEKKNLTPIVILTDTIRMSKPVLSKNSESQKEKQVTSQYAKSIQLTPIKIISEGIEMNKPVLERKSLTPVKILTDIIGMSKAILPKKSESKKEKQVESHFINDINKNFKRKIDLDPVFNKKVRLQEKVINTLNNELLGKNSASQRKNTSVKGNTSHAKRLNQKPAKKNQSGKKNTKCCSDGKCISKFFGLKCPNL